MNLYLSTNKYLLRNSQKTIMGTKSKVYKYKFYIKVYTYQFYIE